MFPHPESLLDLARLEQAERNRHLDHLYTVRSLRAHRAATVRPRLATILRALADRLQPAPEAPAPSADLWTAERWAAIDPWATPRSAHVQRLREHARPHAMAIARRHDVHHLDAA